MKNKAILRGLFVDYFGAILVVLAGFVAIPFYFGFISKEQYGLWLAINSVVLMIALVDLATDQFLTTVTANDEKFYSEEYADYLTSILLVKAASAVVVMLVSSIIFIFLASLLKVAASSRHEAQATFSLAALALVCGIFVNAIPTILYARHHYSLVNAFANFFLIASSVGAIFLLWMGYGIIAFPMAQLISTMLQGFILAVLLMQRFPHVRPRIKNFTFVEKTEILGYATNFQALRWLYTFRTQYISIAINNLIGATPLTQYMLTSRLAQLGPTFAAKFAQAFFPTMANLIEMGDTHKVAEIFIKGSKVLTRAAIFSGIVLFSLNESFVAIWVGEDIYAGDGALILIVVYMMIYIAMAQFAIVIFSSKKFEKWVYWGMLEMIMAVAFSYFFSKWFGLLGVVMGFVLSSLPTQAYLFRIVLRQLDLGTLEFIQEIVRYSLKPNLIPLVFAYTMNLFQIGARTWQSLIGFACLFSMFHLILEVTQIVNSKKVGLRNKIADVLKI